MAVFRVERTQGYTVMSNYHLRDKSLSLKAKGLLSQMLSLPEDWDYTLSGLAVINRESKDAIRSAVNELEKAGYIKRRQTTDAGGKFSANEYVIYERPVTEEPPAQPLPPKPLLEKGAVLKTLTSRYLNNKHHNKAYQLRWAFSFRIIYLITTVTPMRSSERIFLCMLFSRL